MAKAMISQPMRGLSDEEILDVKAKAVASLESKGYEVINTFFEDTPKDRMGGKVSLWYLAKSIEAMSGVDCVYFCKGWENNRGCKIEHECAVEYGLEVIEQ